MAVLLFLVGIYLLAGGGFIAWFRVKHPGRLRRLQDLQRRFGAEKGNVLHFLSYVILQSAVGLFLIVRGLGRFGVL